MKKFVCFILSFALIAGTVVSSFAANAVQEEEAAKPEYPLVIVRGMDFTGLTVDSGTENEHACIEAPGLPAIFSLITALAKTFFCEKKLDIPAVSEFLYEIMGGLACDENGNSRYHVSYAQYPLAVGNYPELLEACEGYPYDEFGILKTALTYYGADNTYYFTYDWRLDPSDTADDLYGMIERAKAEHNTDKVDLVCCSMGGIITDSYLYEYGCDSLHNVVFNSSTFCGTYVTSDLLQGKVMITEEMLYHYVSDSVSSAFFMKLLSQIGLFRVAADLAMKFVDTYKDDVYDAFLRDVFATMPILWALVQPEAYEDCLAYMFPTEELQAQYAGLIDRADRLQEMMRGMDALLLSLPEKGVNVSVVASYNTPMIPVYESAVYQSDGMLETPLMLGRATVSETGKTLGDDYIAADPACLSPDRCIDTSDVLFPESTWAIRGAGHVIGSSGTDLSVFLFWLLTYDGQPTVTSHPAYPRFLYSDSTETIFYAD